MPGEYPLESIPISPLSFLDQVLTIRLSHSRLQVSSPPTLEK